MKRKNKKKESRKNPARVGVSVIDPICQVNLILSESD
jgi:hypothetical protein